MTIQNKPHIGFIGLGRMGSLMATRLLQAGYQVTVYDRTREKVQELTNQGAQATDHVRELATNNDVVISCVTDDHALLSLLSGEEGAIAGASSGKIFIDMSTVSPQTERHIAESLAAKQAHMLDAPVSGSIPQAKDGTLVVFVGGEEEIYRRVLPILSVLGKSVFYMGGHSMGATMKMVVNALLGLGMQAVAEAVALGEKAGLPQERLLDVLAQTSAISPAHKLKLDNLKNREFPTQFSLSLMRKDFGLIMRLATELAVSMPATAVAEQVYAAAAAVQGPDNDPDYSVILQFMGQLAAALPQ